MGTCEGSSGHLTGHAGTIALQRSLDVDATGNEGSDMQSSWRTAKDLVGLEENVEEELEEHDVEDDEEVFQEFDVEYDGAGDGEEAGEDDEVADEEEVDEEEGEKGKFATTVNST